MSTLISISSRPSFPKQSAQVYKGRDPHFPVLKIPQGEVDVVAVARSIPPQVGKERERMLETVESVYKHPNGKAHLSKNNSRRLASNVVPGEGWAGETEYSIFILEFSMRDKYCKA